MPPQVTTTNLLAKMGDRLVKGNQAYAGAETKVVGNVRLPGGIKQGIAHLNKCYFKEYEKDTEAGARKGDLFFYASATIILPEKITLVTGNEMKLKGLFTKIQEPFCDTPKASGERSRRIFFEHQGWVYNFLRILGVDTKKWLAIKDWSVLGPTIEQAATALQNIVRPYVYFDTVQMPQSEVDKKLGKEPFIWENWTGLADYKPTMVVGGGVKDSSPTVANKPSANGTAPPDTKPDNSYTDEGDLATLAKLADTQDEAAIDRLTELALAAGVPESALNDPEVQSWNDIVEMMKGASSEEVTEVGEEEGIPKVDETCDYKPPIFKGVGKNRKQVGIAENAVTCIVVAVDVSNQKFDIKNTDDGKTVYKGVAWDAVETGE